MTIAICVRVGDGIILAADSVTALKAGQGVGQIYEGARKLIRPHLEIPLGFVTFGQGTIEDQSIAGLANGLRERLAEGGQWALDVGTYSVRGVAERVRDYYADRVQTATNQGHEPHSLIGFLVAGYSAHAEIPECWEVEISPHGVSKFDQIDPNAGCSLCYRGFKDPLDRLTLGAAPALVPGLNALGHAKTIYLEASKLTLVRAEMPLAEAVKLADWLAEVTIGAMHFGPGAEVVGGMVDLVRVDRQDGFVWVRQQTMPFQPGAVDVLP